FAAANAAPSACGSAAQTISMCSLAFCSTAVIFLPHQPKPMTATFTGLSRCIMSASDGHKDFHVVDGLVEQRIEALLHDDVRRDLRGANLLDGQQSRFDHSDDARPALHGIAPRCLERDVLQRP